MIQTNIVKDNPNNSAAILEFDRIQAMLNEYVCTEGARQAIQAMAPILDEIKLTAALRETREAEILMENLGTPPMTAMDGIEEMTELAAIGGCLTAEQLENVGVSLTGVRRLKSYLERGKAYDLSLPYYNENLDAMDDLREEIVRTIRGGRIDDYASKLLKSLRSDIELTENKMREKADAVMRANKSAMSDSFSVMRSGHLCVPVKKADKFKIPGSVIAQSASGGTLFIEPVAVAKFSEELQYLRLDEENEERRILYELTGILAEAHDTMLQNIRMIERLDFMFAKGRLSMAMEAVAPRINTDRRINIVNGRHPLIPKEKCVPLNVQLGCIAQELLGKPHDPQAPERAHQKRTGADECIRGLIITGPNTGGKTVAIKTVGLLCMMAQCGLHVPCESAELCMNNQILCDIGDNQNMTENLSTFSAHITNVLDILKRAGQESLVLMDELGSGTDPTEGMGIAVAVLEELRRSGALYMVTTHYPEIKAYANDTPGVVNARMLFDRESLQPLYRLEMGAAGDSCAFYIAARLGMPESMLEAARQAAYGAEARNAANPAASNAANPAARNNTNSTAAPVAHNAANSAARQDGRRFAPHQSAPEKKAPSPSIKKRPVPATSREKLPQYAIGDSVMVYPEKKLGIVYRPINDKGALCVQIQGKKVWLNHKRVRLHVAAKDLYPADYDFSIVFDSVRERKLHHEMERKYVEEVLETEDPNRAPM